MAGFEVVLDDLDRMSSTFDQQAGAYRAVTPQLTPPTADSGDGALNGIMKGAMELIAVLHEQMATSISLHAEKLEGSPRRLRAS